MFNNAKVPGVSLCSCLPALAAPALPARKSVASASKHLAILITPPPLTVAPAAPDGAITPLSVSG